MKFCLIFFLVIGCLTSPGKVEAANSIATVSLDKVFKEYWKTDQLIEKFRKKEVSVREDIKKQESELSKQREKIQRQAKLLNDPSLSTTEKAKRRNQLELSQREYSQTIEAVEQYVRSRQKSLDEDRKKEMLEIMGEIQTVVATRAKAKGYRVVLDRTGKSAAIAPIVVYSADDNDLTVEVLKQLNLSDPKNSNEDKK
tara:strand:- start:21 stop:614 length:594 start_codon:yes stop_codon:yes gene_type:complete